MSNSRDSSKSRYVINNLDTIHSKNPSIQNKFEEEEDAKELEYRERTKNKRNIKKPKND